jgi:hypothetical protein
MIITMQGNWTVAVKMKSAAFPQRFIISGAASGNGTYNGLASTPAVNVTGTQWSISILHDPGTGYRASDTRIKFPTLVGGNYVFDIQSNDTGLDHDFNDLVLTCSTPAMSDDYIIYGHVKSYHGSCIFNPCFPYLVIDTRASLTAAIKNKAVLDALKKLYPERLTTPVGIPNPPDPEPFIPMIINPGNRQIPLKTGVLYRKTNDSEVITRQNNKNALGSDEKNITYSKEVVQSSASDYNKQYEIDSRAIASVIEAIPLFCHTENVPFETLNFQEYDRTISELGGDPYSGMGNRLDLGYAVTDMNGNYIFRFKQSVSELVNEVLYDVAAGEDAMVQYRPDILVRIPDPSSSSVLFESAPYFNVPNLKRINLCFPRSVLNNTRVCMTTGANLIEYVGNVAIGGVQNTTDTPHSRATALNMLGVDGKITAHDTTGPVINCGCWVGRVDFRGCLNDPNVKWYTIRYGKTAGTWLPVSEEYHHQRVSNTDTTDPATKVGPFTQSLKVDGGAAQDIPAYMNIQGQNTFGSGDWFPANIDILNQLNTYIYEAGVPGTVYFKIEAYNSAGDRITSDMISLYIDNSAVDSVLQDAYFSTSVADDCVLFALTDDEIGEISATPLPLKVFFRANHLNGFLQEYIVYMGKGKHNSTFATKDSPAGRAHGVYDSASDTFCTGYIGTANGAGMSLGNVEVDLTPDTPNTAWLEPGQDFCTFTVNLSWLKRCTNGYDNCTTIGPVQFIFGIKRV